MESKSVGSRGERFEWWAGEEMKSGGREEVGSAPQEGVTVGGNGMETTNEWVDRLALKGKTGDNIEMIDIRTILPCVIWMSESARRS